MAAPCCGAVYSSGVCRTGKLTLRSAYEAAESKQWQEAERLLREVLSRSPNCVDALVKLALVLYGLDRLDEARACLEQAVTLEEGQPVLTLLGVIQRRLGDLDAAAVTLRRSIALGPDDDEAHHALGLALRDSDPSEAVEHFRRSLELEPAGLHSRRELGLALWRLGRTDEAMASLRDALQRDEEDAWAHGYLGLIFHTQGRLHEAQAALRRATELEPSNGFFWAHLGRVTAVLGEHEQAERHFLEGLSKDMNESHLQREFGAFLIRTGRLSGARRYLERAIDLNPNDRRTRRLLDSLSSAR